MRKQKTDKELLNAYIKGLSDGKVQITETILNIIDEWKRKYFVKGKDYRVTELKSKIQYLINKEKT